MLTVGTHNLHDHTGTPTPFADWLLFTEAIHSEVSDELHTTHDVFVCRHQRDLVIAVRKGTFKPKRTHYRLVHTGIPKVTPHRGTFWLTGEDAAGTKTALVVEHRINAAFPPFRRGEAIYRPRMWRRHTRITLRIIKRLKRRGYVVVAGGDLNTPRGISGYQGVLREAGSHFDRIGSSRRLSNVAVMSRMGSDHPRLTARVR